MVRALLGRSVLFFGCNAVVVVPRGRGVDKEVLGDFSLVVHATEAVFDLTKPRALLCLKPLLRLCPRRDVMPSRPFACISYGPATQKKHEFGRDRHQIPDSHTTTTTDDGICPIRPLGTVVPLGRLHVYPYKERM